jgi:exonuclease VII small subunit
MTTSINNLALKGQISSPFSNNAPLMPLKPPDDLPNHLDITKHIEDKHGITNMHIHNIGHNNNAIEFVGSKDHINHTQWPITKDMAEFIANNNNLNSKYQPLVIPYSSACYMCNEFKGKNIKKVLLIVFIIIICIIIICVIIYFVNKSKTIDKDNESKRLERSGKRLERSGDRLERSGDRLERSGDRLERSGDRLERSGDRLERSGDRLDNLP